MKDSTAFNIGQRIRAQSPASLMQSAFHDATVLGRDGEWHLIVQFDHHKAGKIRRLPIGRLLASDAD
jgi:hypothetical protein